MGTTEMQFKTVEVSYIYSFHLEWNENFFVKRPPKKVEELLAKIRAWLNMPIIYLFEKGNSLEFTEENLSHADKFFENLKRAVHAKGNGNLYKCLLGILSDDFLDEIKSYASGKPNEQLLKSLLEGINKQLEKGTFSSVFGSKIASLSENARRLLNATTITSRQRKRLNLWLLEEAFPDEIAEDRTPFLVQSDEKLVQDINIFEYYEACKVGKSHEHFRPMFRYFFLGKHPKAEFDHVIFWPKGKSPRKSNGGHGEGGDAGTTITLSYTDEKDFNFSIKGRLYRKLCLSALGTGVYTATLKFGSPDYKEISTPLKNLPDKVTKSKIESYGIEHDSKNRRLISKEAITKVIRDKLLALSPSPLYQQAVRALFENSYLFKNSYFDRNLLYSLINLPTRFKTDKSPRTKHFIRFVDAEPNQNTPYSISELFLENLQSFVNDINRILWEDCKIPTEEDENNMLMFLKENRTDRVFVHVKDFDVVPDESRLLCKDESESLREYNFYQLPSVYIVVKPSEIKDNKDIPTWIAPIVEAEKSKDKQKKKHRDTENWKIFANMLLNLRSEVEGHLDLHYLRRYVYDSVVPEISPNCEDEDAIPNVLPNKNIYTMASMRTFISVCKDLKNKKKNEMVRSVIEEVARTIELVRERWHFSTINNLLLDRVIAEIQQGKGDLYLPQVDPPLFRKIIERRRRCVAFLSLPSGKGHFSRLDPIWKFGHYLWNEMQIDELNEALLKKLHLTETMYTDMFQFQNLSRLEGLDVPQESVREKTSRFLELLLKFREANKDKDRQEAILEEMAKIEVNELKDVLKGS